MDGKKVFKATEIANRVDAAQKKLLQILIQNGHDEEANQLKEELINISDEKRIRLVFIGQYTAGKSTIISALTSNPDIVIDSDISTSSAADYAWGDVILTDTPGLYTEHTEHDAITIDMIRKSDLLIYCITSDLFTKYTLEDFMHWAFTEQYAGKMLLIVNKMSKEAGEYTELQQNYSISINRSLIPHSIGDFPCAFVDAKDYRDGLMSENQALIDYSHFVAFIDQLNSFVKRKGLLGKMDTPIMIMKSMIDNVSQSVSEDESQRAYIALMNRIEKRVEMKKAAFRMQARTIIQNGLQPLIEKGNELSRQVGVSEIKETEESINHFIAELCGRINEEFLSLCQSKADELNNEIEEVMHSETAEFFFHTVEGAMDGKMHFFKSKDYKAAQAKIKSVQEVVERISGKVFNMAVKEGAEAGGILLKAGEAAGSPLHKIVLTIGKKLGHKFKPWEAVNIAKNIGNFAKFLGPIASVVSFILGDVKGAVDESKQALKIKEAQQEFRNLFTATHDEIEQQYYEQMDEVINEYNNIITQINSSKEKVNNVLQANNKMAAQLAELRKELIQIQCDIL